MKPAKGLFYSLDHVNLQALLQRYTEYLIKTFPAIQGVTILLLRDEDSTLVCKGINLPGDLKSVEDSYLGFSFGKINEGKVATEVFTTKKSIILDKDHSNSLTENSGNSESSKRNWGIQQILIVPLLQNDTCFGVVNAFSQTGEVHPANEIENSIKSNQNWIHDLYQSDLLRTKSQEIEFHYKDNLEFTRRSLRISKITTTDEFLETVMTEFLDWLEFDSVFIFYRDMNNLIPRAHMVKYPELQQQCDQWITSLKKCPHNMDLKSGVIPAALIRKNYFYIEDIRSVNPEYMTEIDRIGFETLGRPRTGLHLPLLSGNTPLGVLTLYSITRQVKLTPLQIKSINFMATFVSNSIMNARAYDQQMVAKLEARKKKAEQEKHKLAQIDANNRMAVVYDSNTSDMVAKVSHELRTPIHGILGMTNLLLQTRMTSKQNSFLKQIRQSGISLEHLVNDLLDKAKIESGKLDLESIPFSWSDIYAVLKASLNPIIETNDRYRSVELLFIHAKEVPDQMIGDPKRITQIFTNFLNNALKFTEKGEVVCSVLMKQITAEGIVLNCSIRDTGIGMTEEQRSKLFRYFAQADPSAFQEYEGTGLGLVIAKKLVNLMGGDIMIESEAGVGSCFSFDLALLRDAETESWIEYRKKNIRHKRNIVWIDKSLFRSECVSRHLSELGFSLDIHDDFNAVNKVLYDEKISKVVLDMALVTEQDGWKQWLDGKRDDFTFIHKVSLMGYPVELNNLVISEHLSVIEKPVFMKNLIETLDPLIIDGQVDKETVKEQISLDKIRIMIVDDNKINIQIAAELLKPSGANIMFATNGREAVTLAQKIQVDIILMDMEMPIMDGLTATREIKLFSPETSVIMLTANLGAKYIQQSLDAGAVDCLGKPFEINELLSKIKEWTKK